MSNIRYVRLQELVFDSFLLDCPFEIEKGALLLDTESKKVLLQLRLNILDVKFSEISSITIGIAAFDDAGDEIPEIKPFTYTFRDVYLLGTKSFGDKTPIVLDPRVRKVKVGIVKVTYKDGHVWHYSGGQFTPPKQAPITILQPDLCAQLNRDIQSISQKERVIFIPQQLDDYWLCTCGRPNNNDASKCCRCSLSKKWVFENVNVVCIQKNLDRYKEKVRLENERVRLLEEENRKREEERVRLLEEERIRIKKRNRLILILGTIGLTIAISIAVFFVAILPSIKYSQASRFLTGKDYDTAIYIYASLGDYKNSKEMAKGANYQKAYDLLLSKQYDEAIAIYTNLGDYLNSKDMVLEANYQKANDLLANNQYDEAINLFKIIKDYQDSNNLIIEAYYQNAKDLLSKKRYDDALGIFTGLEYY